MYKAEEMDISQQEKIENTVNIGSNRIQQTVSSDIYKHFEKVVNKRSFLEDAILIALYVDLPSEIYKLLQTRNIEKLKKSNCEISA